LNLAAFCVVRRFVAEAPNGARELAAAALRDT